MKIPPQETVQADVRKNFPDNEPKVKKPRNVRVYTHQPRIYTKGKN